MRYQADPVRWLAADAPAVVDRPTEPPTPRLTPEETAEFLVSQLSALAYAARSERTRLSALYSIWLIYR